MERGNQSVSVSFPALENAFNNDVLGGSFLVFGSICEESRIIILLEGFRFNLTGLQSCCSNEVSFIDYGCPEARSVVSSNHEMSLICPCRYTEETNSFGSYIGSFGCREKSDGTRVRFPKSLVGVE